MLQSTESGKRSADDNTVEILLNEVGSLFVFKTKAPRSRDYLADVLGTPPSEVVGAGQ